MMHRRSVIMVNNSEKVYKFKWSKVEHLLVKPSTGYVSPGEEKDIEIIFFSPQPVEINKVRMKIYYFELTFVIFEL